MKISLKKNKSKRTKKKSKILFRHTKSERIHDQQTHSTRKIQESPSGGRKMMLDGNIALETVTT